MGSSKGGEAMQQHRDFDPASLAALLSDALEFRGLTVGEWAADSGIPYTTAVRLVCGHFMPTTYHLRAIQKALPDPDQMGFGGWWKMIPAGQRSLDWLDQTGKLLETDLHRSHQIMTESTAANLELAARVRYAHSPRAAL